MASLLPRHMFSKGTVVLDTWSKQNSFLQFVRYAKNRAAVREARKDQVIQYQSVGGKLAERVYVWGHAATGALGVRTYLRPERNQVPKSRQNRPARLRFMDENDIVVTDVACGYGFTLFAAKKRRKHVVMGTGINTDSQLGYHEFPRNSGRVLDYIIEPVPVDIPYKSETTTEAGGNCLQVSCGRAHSVILTKNGVYAQGNNAYGQCGHTPVEGEVFSKVSNIKKVEGIPDNVKKVVCGQDHTLFLTEDGQVYSCGLGVDGQTGLGTFNVTGNPERVKGDIDGEKITDIVSQSDVVLAINDKGQVFGWGNSEYSQFAVVTKETQVNVPHHLPYNVGRVIDVATGGSICALLNDRGEVYVWGFGILGKGPNVDMLKEPSILPPALFGHNELQPDVKVTQIKCGMSHFAAITDQGDLYTWGKGKFGCLGLHKSEVQFFPLKVSLPASVYRVECGVDHTIALAKSFS